MHQLSTIQTKNFQSWAQQAGLAVLDGSGDEFVFELPPVASIVDGKTSALPPVRLKNYRSTVVHLPEGVIRGQKLATIFGGALLPTGYSHSFNWVEESGFSTISKTGVCEGAVRQEIDIRDDGADYYLLGLTSHFGHFFVDCLDRLLAIERLVKVDRPVRYIVDAKPIPQVRQVIDLLGIDIRDASLVVPNPTADYRVRNLRVTSLNSMKPAISLSTFSEFRRRALLAIKQSRAAPFGIYVGRKAVTKRLILNQPEIETYLSNLGISSFYPEEHSFIEAAEVFHSCQVVVIVIGSSKFNLALCQPGTKVICLVPEGYAEKPGSVALMVRQLCALFKLNLCFCSCRIQGGMGLDSDLIVEKSFLQEALRTLAVG